MSNRYYRNLANDIVDMTNEQNETYVAVGGESSANLPANQSPSPSVPESVRESNNQRNNPASNEACNEGIPRNAENVERIFGYDEVFDSPASTDYYCPICILVLRNPVQTPCGHRFCATCIKSQTATNGPTCPIDNQELDQNAIYADNFAKREINKLPVKCRTLKNKKECPWSGALQNIEEHLKTCEFVEVPCPKGCNQNVERKALEHHLKKDCSKRSVTCQYCKIEVQHKNYKDHLGKCRKVVVACPNCNKKMLREKLASGHDKECPKAQAVCEFKPYGCKWTGLRIHLGNHLTSEASMSAHLSLLCNACTVLLPGNGRNKGGASRTESSGGASGSSSGIGAVGGNVLELLNRARNRNEQIERGYRDIAGRTERQQSENEASATQGRTQTGAIDSNAPVKIKKL